MKLLSKLLIPCAVVAFLACASGHAYADGVVLVSPAFQKLVPPLAALNLQHQAITPTKQAESAGMETATSTLAISARGHTSIQCL